MMMEISRVGLSWRRASRVMWNLKQQDHGLRFFTQKASNRSAVHGLKQPINERIDEEEVAKEIKKGKEEKQSKRKEVEEKINSQLNSHQDCNK